MNDLIDDEMIEAIEEIEEKAPTWEQLPDESDRAYAAFLVYRDLGAHRRSLRRACALIYGEKENVSGLFQWSKEYKWIARCVDYDKYIRAMEEAKWMERRLELKEKDWDLGSEMREKAKKVLDRVDDFIIRRERFERGRNGEPDKIIIEERIDMPTAIKMIEVATKLERLAAGEPTESISMPSHYLDELIKKELEKMTNGDE